MAKTLDSDAALGSEETSSPRRRTRKTAATSEDVQEKAPKRRGRPATKKKSTEDAYALLAEAQKDIVPITESTPNLDSMLGLEALGLPSVPDAIEAAVQKPKRRPGRPRKTAAEKEAEKAAKAEANATDEAPKKRRTTRKKAEVAEAEQASLSLNIEPEGAAQEAVTEPVKPRRTRRKKVAEETVVEALDSESQEVVEPKAEVEAEAQATEPAPKTRRRRTLKSKAEEPEEPKAEQVEEPKDAAEKAETSESSEDTDKTTEKTNRDNRSQNKFDRTSRRPNRRKNVNEPSITLEQLKEMEEEEIRALVPELSLEGAPEDLDALCSFIANAVFKQEGFRHAEGILDIQKDGYSYLRTGNYGQGDHDAFVHSTIIRNYALRPGDFVEGICAPPKAGNKFPPLAKIEKINGLTPEQARLRPRFKDLTPIYPDERLVMENGKESSTGRAIDLVAPIGKGQRGLIVSPPKAGKTTVLKHICKSIAHNNPEVHLFCLLVDERPEEVTDMERSVKGTVVASTFDQPAQNHTAVAELVIERAKRLVELGEDVVVILDSITRLARAYNLACPASGRILSGGVDSAALYPPKKFLGAARNIEGGGSLTILASALVDTGSKMDEVIFEEFKGTGNMELKLDRDLADRRIFPAIDPVQSGTRNEDLLIDSELQPFVWGLRRILANMNSTERAATALVKGLKGTNNNNEFLIRTAKKAAQQEFVATL